MPPATIQWPDASLDPRTAAKASSCWSYRLTYNIGDMGPKLNLTLNLFLLIVYKNVKQKCSLQKYFLLKKIVLQPLFCYTNTLKI